MSLKRLSELDAVNQMLSAIGEAPTSHLPEEDEGAVNVDVVRAKNELDRQNRKIQSRGWSFNTEEDIELSPNNEGKIVVGEDIVAADATDTSVHVVLRGDTLFDLDDNTDEFDDSVTCDLVRLLDWESLPDHARQYIAAKATTKFVASSLGNDSSAFNVAAAFEAEAKSDFNRHEIKVGDHNMIRRYKPAGLRKLRW